MISIMLIVLVVLLLCIINSVSSYRIISNRIPSSLTSLYAKSNKAPQQPKSFASPEIANIG
jgi:cell shape-determining protein MreC